MITLISRSLLALACAFCGLAANHAHAAPFKVVGYFVLGDDASKIHYDTMTHLNFAFLVPQKNGALEPLDSDDAKQLDQLVATAHQHGVKTLISVGGWGTAAAFEGATATEKLRETFVQNMMTFVANHHLDGIDIDWEYPGPNKPRLSAAYLDLMRRLSQRLHANGELLTTAISPESWIIDSYQPKQLSPLVDWINIMAYDNNSHDGHSTFAFAQRSLAACVKDGIPKDKCVLGLPFYGRKRADFAQDIRYSQLLQKGANPHADLFHDWAYNGIDTIQKKVALAKREAGGVMIWQLGQDADASNPNALQNAIRTALRGSPSK